MRELLDPMVLTMDEGERRTTPLELVVDAAAVDVRLGHRSAEHSNGFDLDEVSRLHQTRDLHHRRRGIRLTEIAPPYLVNLFEMRHVPQVHSHLHNVGKPSACFLQDRLKEL